MSEPTTSAVESLDPAGKLFKEKLAIEVFNQKVRRDARRALEQEDRELVASTIPSAPVMIYDPLPTDTPKLIPGLLPESGTLGIIGETNTGKSLIALEIGSSLLTGEPLWGALQPTRRIDKVVYILGEHTCQTIQGLFHYTQLPHTGNFQLIGPEHLHPHKALVVGGVQQAAAVDRLLRWTEGAGLIVFDPIGGFAQGLNTENDSASMRTLIDSMSLIASKQGAACVLLSHMGKPKMDEQGNEIRRTTYAARGSSAQEDAMTHVFYLRKSLSVKQQKNAFDSYDLSVRKFKGNPSDEVFKLQRNPANLRHTLAGTRPVKGAISREEKEEYRRRIQKLAEANSGFTWDTCIKLTADMEGIPLETLKRHLSEV